MQRGLCVIFAARGCPQPRRVAQGAGANGHLSVDGSNAGAPATSSDVGRMNHTLRMVIGSHHDRSQSLYAWFLHADMLDSVFDDTARSRLFRHAQKRFMAGDHLAYTRELESWMRNHSVPSLEVAIATERCSPGVLVWCELPFHWSAVASERRRRHAGEGDVRSSFHVTLELGGSPLLVRGTFDPIRLTSTTANNELSGVRTQFMLGQVAGVTHRDIELRPIAIATRLLSDAAGWPHQSGRADDGQRIAPSDVEQFQGIDFSDIACADALMVMKTVPELQVKQILAKVLGEPVVPNDWGGEQSDLWTTRLRVNGMAYSAAFLLKGPAGGRLSRPMTIGMLGKNGDQIQRLASTPAEVLVVQHCHEIRPEVVAMLRGLASDFRNIRHYMLIDGYDSYAILKHNATVA